MFTGIIEEIGIVKSLKKESMGAVISIQCKTVLEDLKIGDSIAINGACQTAIKIGSDYLEVEAAFETLKLTNLGELKSGERVNLERAMIANGRFGGHVVSGHVDDTGKFLRKENQGIADIYYFYAPDEVVRYMVYKGSISINGISLTIASLNGNEFSISVISHTSKETTLADLKIGDVVNLESDIMAKYIEKFVGKSDNKSGNITESYLKEHGFYD